MKNTTGSIAEKLAQKWLVKNKFKIIAQNVWLAKYGEIDIIARKGGCFHFIEVKSLSESIEFSPEIHFTKNKRAKVKKLAQYFANKNGFENFQVDLLTIAIFVKRAKIKLYLNVS